MSDRATENVPRYFYFRAHNHPMGWGVQDSKSDSTIALGDKSLCCTLANLLNDDPWGASLLDGWTEAFDSWGPDSPRYKYDHETGELVANNRRGK